MPIYEYFCEANGRTVEVSHKMQRRVRSWGELCTLAGIDAGRTAAKTPVAKLISSGFVNTGGSADTVPPCEGGTGPGCGSGMCGMQ